MIDRDVIKLLKNEPSEVSFWLLDGDGKYCGVNDGWFIRNNNDATRTASGIVRDRFDKFVMQVFMGGTTNG